MNKAEIEQQRRKEIMDKGQRVVSNTADFDEGTWTFNTIGDDVVIAAGTFIVIPLEKFEEIQKENKELRDYEIFFNEFMQHFDENGLAAPTHIALKRAKSVLQKLKSAQSRIEELEEA